MNKILPLTLLTALGALAPATSAADPAEKPAAPAKTPAKPTGKYKVHATLKSAMKAAAEEKKTVYLLFTGPGWCHYCNALEKDVLATKEWKTWAAENVAVYIVASRGGPGNEQGEGKKLASEYKFRGYPTAYLLTPEGKRLGTAGGLNPGETAQHYIKSLEARIAAGAQ